MSSASEAGVQIALLYFHPTQTPCPAHSQPLLGELSTSVPLGVNGYHSSSASQQQPRFQFRDRICDSQMSLANEALAGFQKGQAYDQNRPSYLPEVVDKLLQALHISGVAGAEVLDLAAGTGKFTELLAKQDERFQITAVEPHHDMRNELEKKHLSNVNVLNGLATKIPLADKNVDAVVVAQVRCQIIIITMLFLPCGLLVGFISSLFVFPVQLSRAENLPVRPKSTRFSATVSSTLLVTCEVKSLAPPRRHPEE